MGSDGCTNPTFVDDSGKGNNAVDNILKPESFKMEISNKSRKDDSYNPYLERSHVEHPLTNNETTIHLLKSSLGTGILAMPKAYYHAGYIVGSIGTIVIGSIAVYSIQLLLRIHYELCKRNKVPCMDYPTIAKSAFLEGPRWMHKFAPYIVHVTNFFLLIYQLGICCIYFVFIGENMKSIADHFTKTDNDIRMFMLIILLPIILLNWVRNLKYLAPFSTLANAITIISFAIICYFLFREPIVLDNRRTTGPIGEFPFFFGTVLFSLEAIGMIMPLENEMRKPKDFVGLTGVLNRAFLLIIVLYIGMGLFGYLKYGNDIRDSITLNLEVDDPIDEILALSVKGMLAFGIFITHGIACYVAIDLVWNKYVVNHIKKDQYKLLYEYVLRTVIVLITFLLAVAIPKLDLFISLFGALCLSSLGLAFPALFETCVFLKDQKTRTAKAVMITKNLAIGLFGLAGFIIGSGTSIMAIIETFRN